MAMAILCACLSLNRSSMLTLFCICFITCTNLLHTVAASFSCVHEHRGIYVPGIEDHVGTTGRTEVASTAFKRVWMGLRHRAGGCCFFDVFASNVPC